MTKLGHATTWSLCNDDNLMNNGLIGKKRKSDDIESELDLVSTTVKSVNTVDTINTIDTSNILHDSFIDLNDKIYVEDKLPIISGCNCHACKDHSRSYIHHLLKAHELLGTVCNVMYFRILDYIFELFLL